MCVSVYVQFTWATWDCDCDCDSRIEMRIPLIHYSATASCARTKYSHQHEHTHNCDVSVLMRTYSLTLSHPHLRFVCCSFHFVHSYDCRRSLVTHRNGSECKVTFMCVYSEDVYMCEAYMGVSECERWNGEHRPTNRRTSDWVRPRIACTHTHTTAKHECGAAQRQLQRRRRRQRQ